MYESKKIKNLIESVKKVLREENLTEAAGTKKFPVRWREATIKTNGTTLYAITTDAAKPVPVKVTKVELVAYDNNFDGWNLAVKAYFDTKTWNVGRMGHLVTDKGFEKNFRDELQKQGYPVGRPSNLSWAEQGMQGKDYVLFDIYSGGNNKGIEKEWIEKFKVPAWREERGGQRGFHPSAAMGNHAGKGHTGYTRQHRSQKWQDCFWRTSSHGQVR